jgi:PIN domain nuclease of toxin-antitoxin system
MPRRTSEPSAEAATAVLLDTCAALWLMNGDRLSSLALDAIRSAQRTGLGVQVSPFTAWEVGTLVSKGRLRLGMSADAWFDALLGYQGVQLALLTPAILIESTRLPDGSLKDPADKIIVATARHFRWPVVTRDAEIASYAKAGHLKVIGC